MLFIGAKHTLYLKRSDGRLQKFGVRISGWGIEVFDPLTRTWLTLPDRLNTRGGGSIAVTVDENE